MKKTKTRTLLTNKKEAMRTSSRAGVRLEKIPENALNGSKKQQSFSVDPKGEIDPEITKLATEEGNVTLPLTLKNQKLTRKE